MMFRHPRPFAGITVARTADAVPASCGFYPRINREIWDTDQHTRDENDGRSPRFWDSIPATTSRVPHTPDFLWSSVSSLKFLRLSFKKGAHVALCRAAWQEIRVHPLCLSSVGDSAVD